MAVINRTNSAALFPRLLATRTVPAAQPASARLRHAADRSLFKLVQPRTRKRP